MGLAGRCSNCFKVHWNGLFFILSPLVMIPLIFFDPKVEFRSSFVFLWVFVWFVVDAAPQVATACLPIVFLPLLGVSASNDTCMSYFGDANALFVLCNFVAVTVQQSNVAKYYAFFILTKITSNPRKILLVLMIGCYLLTAIFPASFVCALAMPTIRAMMGILENAQLFKAVDEDVELKDDERPYPSKEASAFFIGTAFAINIGDMATSLCSATGLSMREIIRKDQSLNKLDGSFGLDYFGFALPVSLVLLIVTIATLQILYFGTKSLNFDVNAAKTSLAETANDLPPINIYMSCVFVLYIVALASTVMVAILAPEVNNNLLKFSVNAMVLCFFYFILPIDCDFCNYFCCNAPKNFKTAPSVLPWGPVNKLTPWKTYFVHGCSSCFGMVLKETNLYDFLGCGAKKWDNLVARKLGLVALTMLLTIVSSNGLLAEAMMPAGITAGGKENAKPFLYPMAWATGITFLLPMSSPANSFALGWGDIRTKDMMLAAIIPTVFGFLLIFIVSLCL